MEDPRRIMLRLSAKVARRQTLTTSERRTFRRAFERVAATFQVGDVVLDEEHPEELGIVTAAFSRSVDVVWAHGGRAGGPGLLFGLRHQEPRLRVGVPKGANSVRAWNREQAVRATLRRAGLGEGTRYGRG